MLMHGFSAMCFAHRTPVRRALFKFRIWLENERSRSNTAFVDRQR